MEKLEKKWVESWDEETIIGTAFSLGMEFQATFGKYKSKDADLEIVKENKKLLVDAILNKTRCEEIFF